MELRKLNRNMIELAVIQGIREIRQDSNRGMRRMADLAQHFAEKNFHDSVFLKIQAALLEKDSRYYQMIRNIINQVDENYFIKTEHDLDNVKKNKYWLCFYKGDKKKND